MAEKKETKKPAPAKGAAKQAEGAKSTQATPEVSAEVKMPAIGAPAAGRAGGRRPAGGGKATASGDGGRKPASSAADKRAEKPAARAGAKSAAKPAEKAAGKTVRGRATKPAAKPAAKPADPLQARLFKGDGSESGTLELPAAVFGETPHQAVMHQALLRQLANRRAGTADTRTRAEVSGGGKKPFRQKGLGRSRHGSTREPSMVGGGTVFGPQPRSFRQDMPRKMRRLALRSALSSRAADGSVTVIEGFADLEVPRTAVMAQALRAIAGEGRVLVVLPAANDLVSRSVRNLSWAKAILAGNLNVHDVFTHEHLVIHKDALEFLEETFA